ncbi:MAG: hypothetical protein PHO70_07540 [Candidatus Omnitrophica bacterium]|nr:hypothetical protein [Candidatus Omnitrophota bacterium]
MNEEHKDKQKWYFKTSFLVVAFLAVGPLALPLLWFNPHLSIKLKVIITVVIAILTVLLWHLTANSLKTIDIYIKMMPQF